MFSYQLSAFADESGKDFMHQIEALKRNGIALMEIRGVDGKSVADLTNDEAKEARRKLDDAGVGLSSLGSPYGKYPVEKDFAPHRDAFRRGLELCDILGVKRIRMFSFFIPAGDSANAWRGKVIDQLGMMLDDAKDAGIFLAHENEKGIYGETDDACVDLMNVYGDRMGCIFDPANFIQAGVKPILAYPKLEKWISYMHIKDAMLQDGSVVPAGKGDGDIPGILTMLGAKADNMTLTLEPHLRVFDGLAALQNEELTHRYHYATADEAFDAAVSALKDVLVGIGYAGKDKGVWAK